jgi:hypothetical protein
MASDRLTNLSMARLYTSGNERLKFSFRTIGICTTCLAAGKTAIGADVLHRLDPIWCESYVEVEVEDMVELVDVAIFVGRAFATAQKVAHNTTENFMSAVGSRTSKCWE